MFLLHRLAIVCGLLAVVSVTTSAAEVVAAQSDGTSEIEVTVFRCPVGYAESDYATACTPDGGRQVWIDSDTRDFGDSGDTGADGLIAFAGVGKDDFTILIDVTNYTADFVTICDGGEVQAPGAIGDTDAYRFGLAIESGVVARCTVYFIPHGVTALPTTGIGDPVRGNRDWWPGLAFLAVGALVIVDAVSRRRAV